MTVHNRKNWKYEVSFSKKAGGSSRGISWEQLVEVVAERSPQDLKEVKFFYPDMPGGTMQIPGSLMLLLWQEVNSIRQKKSSQ